VEVVSDPTYLALLEEMRELHIEKSSGYGNASDPLANFAAVSALTGDKTYRYPILRSIEKLSRCMSLLEQGRDDELGEEFKDVAGLMLCAEALRRRPKGTT
jgi:hypothetical protein